MNQNQLKILYDIRGVVRMHRLLGICGYQKTPGLKKFLQPANTPKSTGAVIKKYSRKKPDLQKKSAPISARQTTTELNHLREEISGCSRCSLSQQRQGIVTGSGNAGSRLMVIGDWSFQEEGNFEDTRLFGIGEDEMFWKMMTAINMTVKDIYLTNCLKCCPDTDITTNIENEQTCFPYLKREISALKPMVICCMGEMATRLLLGKNDPLVRLRGRFHAYRDESGGHGVVMPTFHPRFLLQHPEMKRAVWLDLQMIQQRLRVKVHQYPHQHAPEPCDIRGV